MRTTTWMSLLLLAAGAACAQVTPGPATDPDFPIFGAGSGQIFRLAVAGSPPPVGDCHAMLSFRDLQNRAFGPSLEVNVGAHHSAFLDLNPRAMGVPLGQRIHFRPVLTHFSDSGPCERSFEVFEPTSGRTIAWNPPPSGDFQANPPPVGDFEPNGFAAGQTLLFAVVRSTQPPPIGDMPPPCNALLEITGPEGNVLAAMLTGALLPGNAAVLALNANTLGLRLGQRLEVQASMSPPPAGDFIGGIGGCIASAQLVDNFSQWTTTMLVN